MHFFSRIAQTKQAHERISDELYEMSKPLARYADDEDLEKMLREREREGDPMLAFFRSKKGAKTTQEGRPKKSRLLLRLYCFIVAAYRAMLLIMLYLGIPQTKSRNVNYGEMLC